MFLLLSVTRVLDQTMKPVCTLCTAGKYSILQVRCKIICITYTNKKRTPTRTSLSVWWITPAETQPPPRLPSPLTHGEIKLDSTVSVSVGVYEQHLLSCNHDNHLDTSAQAKPERSLREHVAPQCGCRGFALACCFRKEQWRESTISALLQSYPGKNLLGSTPPSTEELK